MAAKVPKVRMAASVKPHHGHTFVEEWLDSSFDSGIIQEAFGETRLVDWPSSTARKMTPAQSRYRDIEDEIINRMLDIAKVMIAEAFVNAASEVLAREREAQRRR